jgi:serine/threonine-protein kinase
MIGGRYRPQRLLGQGGMGAVYVVEHAHTGEHLALKVLLAGAGASADRVERFKRESRASAQIRSENVVRVTDADVAPELGGAPYLVMELLDGRDLGAVAETPQTPGDVVAWMTQVARALDKAHALGLIHRDLKPENLFLSKREDGTALIKILDFGLVKMTLEAGAGNTQTGEVLGTPRYMSPEQAQGETDTIGPATDVWALGLVVYRLLTGEDYWDAKTVTHLLAKIVYEPILTPTQKGHAFGDALDAWFLRSCDRDPSRRFATVGEQMRGLETALTGASPTSRAPTKPPASTRTLEEAPTMEAAPGTSSRGSVDRSRPRSIRLGAAAGVVAVVAVLAAVAASRRTDATPPPIVAPSAEAKTDVTAPPIASVVTVTSVAPAASPAPVESAAPRPAAPRPGPPAKSTKSARPDPLGDQKLRRSTTPAVPGPTAGVTEVSGVASSRYAPATPAPSPSANATVDTSAARAADELASAHEASHDVGVHVLSLTFFCEIARRPNNPPTTTPAPETPSSA